MNPDNKAVSLVKYLSDNAARFLVIAAASYFVYLFMSNILLIKRKTDSSSPSSFFALDNLVSDSWFKSIKILFSRSAALLYAAVALHGASLMNGLVTLLLKMPHKSVPIQDSVISSTLGKIIPDWLNPIFVLILVSILFNDAFKKVLIAYRDIVFAGAGVYSLVDEEALEAAYDLSTANESIKSKLNEKLKQAPMPEALLGEQEKKRIAYQIIWLNSGRIRKLGFVDALEAFKRDLGFTNRASGRSLKVARFAAAVTVFSTLIGMYIVFIPLMHQFVSKYGLKWPDMTPAGWRDFWQLSR